MGEVQIKFKFIGTDYMTSDELNNKKEIMKMNNGNLALKLVEGTKADRDQYINRVDVLDRVKELVMLPNEKYVTTNDIVNYYGVNVQTIRNMKNRHNEEFTSDGVITIKGQELKKYKERIQSTYHVLIKGNAHLTLYTRRSVLRMGMLLTESPVALKIQDYLLNVEESATKEQKQNAFEWNKELDQYVFDTIKQSINKGESIIHSIKDIANEIGTTKGVVMSRWYTGNKELKPLRDRLNNETKELVSKGEHLRLVPKQNDNNLIDEMNNTIKQQQELLLQVVSELHTLKETNDKIYKGMGSIWRGHKELKESHDELKTELNHIKKEITKHNKVIDETYTEKVNILEKRLDVQSKKLKKERDELQKAKSVIADGIINNKKPIERQTFKADRNGNLTKIN